MSNLVNLQQALEKSSGKPAKSEPVKAKSVPRPVPKKQPEETTDVSNAETERAPSRVGQVNISAWMNPGYKSSLRLIQSKKTAKLQELLEEALNDLFAKYDVPVIRKD